MTLFTCLILIFSFNFGFFKEKYSLNSALNFLEQRLLKPDTEISKIKFLVVLCLPSLVALLLSLFLYFAIHSFYGAVITLLFWVLITYLCFNQHEPWEHYQNLLRATEDNQQKKLSSVAKSAAQKWSTF